MFMSGSIRTDVTTVCPDIRFQQYCLLLTTLLNDMKVELHFCHQLMRIPSKYGPTV